MTVECKLDDELLGFCIKIVLSRDEIATLDNTTISVAVPASHTEYNTWTRITIEKEN